jgi:hypothetical protein
MHNDTFRAHLTDYILSGHAYLHCPTTEKTRFLAELKALAEGLPDGGRQVLVWSQATGWQDHEGNAPPPVQNGQPDPQKAPQEILTYPKTPSSCSKISAVTSSTGPPRTPTS